MIGIACPTQAETSLFATASRPPPWSTQPHIQCVVQKECKADHPLCAVQSQENMKLCPHSITHLYGMLFY
jgi:hypothetical protein